jgi:WD40 repeat protein
LAVLVGENVWLLDSSSENLYTLIDQAKSPPVPSAVAWLGTTRKLLIGIGPQLVLLDTAAGTDAFQSAKTIFRQPSRAESLVSSPRGDWIASLDRDGNVRIAGYPIRTTLQRTLISPGMQDDDDHWGELLTLDVAGNRLLCHFTSGLVEVLERKTINAQQSWEKLFSRTLIRDSAIGNRMIAFLGRNGHLIAYPDNTFERALIHVRDLDGARRVLVSQDDRWLVAWGDARVFAYDLSKPNEVPRVYHAQHAIRSLRFSMDQRKLVILDNHPQLTVLDLASLDVLNQHWFDADQPDEFEIPLVIANDYAFAISGGSIHAVATSPPTRRDLNLGGDRVTREAVRKTSLPFSNWQAPAISSWVSQTGEGLFLIPRANSLRAFLVGDAQWQQRELWRGADWVREMRKWKLTDHHQIVVCSPDRNWILSASGSDVWLWYPGGEVQIGPKRLPIDFNSNVTAAAFSSDGRFLALGFESGDLRFWPLSADGEIKNEVTIPLGTDPIEKLIFRGSGEGLVIACGSGVFHLSLDTATFARQIDALVNQSQRVRSQVDPRLQPTDR